MRRLGWAMIVAAGSAGGQDLLVTLEQSGPGRYSIVAEFLSDLPGGASAIGTVWSDTNFELTGDGTDIEWVSTNPSYTSLLFGSPLLTRGPTASFLGIQAGAPFGTPDPSNPLLVAEFAYAGDAAALDMMFLGFNTAVFPSPLTPMGFELLIYTADGQPGDTTIGFQPIPAPASVAVLGAGLVALRRRR